ncbi:MAG: hypothetical protein HC803_09200 [Saprospiraceae bacterium]|nr:hypothetical protein [Saprospiraceae bacterium]
MAILSVVPNVQGQTKETNESELPKIDENMFMETRWKYTQTVHASSATVIHEASDGYKFLYILNMITIIKRI